MHTTVRSYHQGDLGRVVALCNAANSASRAGGLAIDDVVELVSAATTETLLAERDGELVGMAIGSAQGAIGAIHRVLGGADAVEGLVEELEQQLARRGARALTVTAGADSQLRGQLEDRGYEAVDTVLLRRELAHRDTPLDDLGGRIIDPGLWDELEGMQDVKDVIERRIILPLAEVGLAERHGVSAPQSVVLFGPPGTGKTTFAKGIASRLGWPFVAVEVGELAGDDRDDPQFLAATFDRLLAAPSAVAFFDEVEDLAADRQSERRVSRVVTNEFLRQLPRARASHDHLLVCATNAVGDLDAAFLRPGRFDYVVPVGPPNEDARAAIWRRYVTDITDEDVDLEALVGASERFTPADIEFAARKAAQFAFEAEYSGTSGRRARTDEFLSAIRETRPTLTGEMIETFERDAEQFARY